MDDFGALPHLQGFKTRLETLAQVGPIADSIILRFPVAAHQYKKSFILL